MLGKLLKYDLKYGVKIFVLIHAILFIASILGRIFFMNRIDFEHADGIMVSSLVIFSAVMMFLYMVVCFSTWLLIAIRFYRNLFTREGYLSWTLPVSGIQQLWAKILSGCIWFILDCIICALGVLILVTGKNVTDAYSTIAPEVTKELGMTISSFGLSIFVITLVSSIGSVILVYFCITMGQLFPAHRVLGALAVYFIYSIVVQIISSIILVAMGLFPNYLDSKITTQNPADYMLTIFGVSMAIMAVTTVIQYIVIHYIIKNKINLV